MSHRSCFDNSQSFLMVVICLQPPAISEHIELLTVKSPLPALSVAAIISNSRSMATEYPKNLSVMHVGAVITRQHPQLQTSSVTRVQIDEFIKVTIHHFQHWPTYGLILGKPIVFLKGFWKTWHVVLVLQWGGSPRYSSPGRDTTHPCIQHTLPAVLPKP